MRPIGSLLALMLLFVTANTSYAHDSIKLSDIIDEKSLETLKQYAVCYGRLKQCNEDNEDLAFNKNMFINEDGQIVLSTRLGNITEGQFLQPSNPQDRKQFLERIEELKSCHRSFVECLDDIR